MKAESRPKILTLLLLFLLLLNFPSPTCWAADNSAPQEVVKGPAKELKVYRGVWMPALTMEILSGKKYHPMSDVETLRRDGVNIVGFAVKLAVNKDGSLNVDLFNLHLQAAKEALSKYHGEGFETFLTLEVSYGDGEGEPVPVPREVVEKPGFIEQYNSLVLELAKVAQEYNVEIFAPTLEPDYYLGGLEFAAQWCRDILPKVREYYKGKLMVRLAFQEIALQKVDFNIQGYDILGICIYPFEDTEVSRERVKLFIEEALKLAEKYDVPTVTTEFGIWGATLQASMSEEKRAEAIRVVLEEGEGRLDGFFIFDPPVSMNWSLKGSLAEQVLREWYTERLLEPATLETTSLTISPGEVAPGESVEIKVEVSNLGEKSGEKELTLKVNGEIEEAKTIMVEGGEKKTVTFKVARSKPGLYLVEVDGLQGSFTVKEIRFGFVGPGPAGGEAAFIPHLDLGFRWDRPHPGPFIWGKIEPVKGFYDFSETDLYVKKAQELGIRVMATIWPYAEWDQEYWRQQPGWQASQGFEELLPESRYKPHDMEAYKAFVRALVERYDGDGVNDMPGLLQPIKHWEVINEPEMGLKGENLNFFKGTPADYLEVVKATYEAVKEADPEAKILNGGIAYVPETADEWGLFWGEFFNLGGGQYIDIITFHNLNPHVSKALERLKGYLKAHGIDKPIWLTELQVAEGFDLEFGMIGEEEQAELVVKACVEGFAGGIEKIFYTAYMESSQVPENLAKSALIRADGTPKKAYYAYKTMIALLEGFSSVEALDEGLYRFSLPDLEVYVLYPGVRLPQTVTGKILAVNLEGCSELTEADTFSASTSLTFIVHGSEEKLRELQKRLSEALGRGVAEASSAAITVGSIEVAQGEFSHTIIYPLEQSCKFTIPVKNVGSEKVRLHPSISGVPEEWICIGGGDLVLEPGEEGYITYAFTIFPGVKTVQKTVTVTIQNLTKPDSPPATVTLNVGFQEIKLPKTSEIRGRIVDKHTGLPVPNAEVRVCYWSNLECGFAVSGMDGCFKVEVPSSQVLEEIYEGFNLRGEPILHLEVSAEGYEHYSEYSLRVPPEGLNLNIELSPLQAEASYKLVWAESVEGYGIWKCIPSEDWSLIAVCQGEHGFPGITIPPQTTNVYLFRGEGELLWKRQIERESWAVDLARDGSKIASGSHAGKVYVWNRKGDLLWMVDVGPQPVREVKFSPDGRYLAFGPTPQGRGYVGLYDAETGSLLWSYETGDHVREIEFSSDGQYVAVSSTDGYTYLFTIEGRLLWKRYHGGYLPFMLKISENNDLIVVAGKSQELYAYDFQGNLRWKFEAPEVIQYGEASSDLSRILIFSNSALYMFDRDGNVLWWRKIPPIGHNALAITPDGKYIVAGCMDELIPKREGNHSLAFQRL